MQDCINLNPCPCLLPLPPAPRRVSTLEAVAALLYELEGDETHVSTLHDNLR